MSDECSVECPVSHDRSSPPRQHPDPSLPIPQCRTTVAPAAPLLFFHNTTVTSMSTLSIETVSSIEMGRYWICSNIYYLYVHCGCVYKQPPVSHITVPSSAQSVQCVESPPPYTINYTLLKNPIWHKQSNPIYTLHQ